MPGWFFGNANVYFWRVFKFCLIWLVSVQCSARGVKYLLRHFWNWATERRPSVCHHHICTLLCLLSGAVLSTMTTLSNILPPRLYLHSQCRLSVLDCAKWLGENCYKQQTGAIFVYRPTAATAVVYSSSANLSVNVPCCRYIQPIIHLRIDFVCSSTPTKSYPKRRRVLYIRLYLRRYPEFGRQDMLRFFVRDLRRQRRLPREFRKLLRNGTSESRQRI